VSKLILFVENRLLEVVTRPVSPMLVILELASPQESARFPSSTVLLSLPLKELAPKLPEIAIPLLDVKSLKSLPLSVKLLSLLVLVRSQLLIQNPLDAVRKSPRPVLDKILARPTHATRPLVLAKNPTNVLSLMVILAKFPFATEQDALLDPNVKPLLPLLDAQPPSVPLESVELPLLDVMTKILALLILAVLSVESSPVPTFLSAQTKEMPAEAHLVLKSTQPPPSA